ncbi:MAG: dihydropteroate synthase [Ferruginibacter sp.]
MFRFRSKGKIYSSEIPVVMGIINITTDSFYKGFAGAKESEILRVAEGMINEGAYFLDLGGQSTKPGSGRVSGSEEAERILPFIQSIHKNFPDTLISVDTFYPEVAQAAVQAGAGMVNDISGGQYFPEMFSVVAKLRVPYIGMHIKGTPETMSKHTNYEDIITEMLQYFARLKYDCYEAGIHDLIIDPGFGFAKNACHNFELLRKLNILQALDVPVLAGLSRKSTIYKTLGCTANEALNGTTVMHTLALNNGASILRAHDVKEAQEAITLFNHYKG